MISTCITTFDAWEILETKFDVKIAAIEGFKYIKILGLDALMGNLETSDANKKAMTISLSDDDFSNKEEEDLSCNHITLVVMIDEQNCGHLEFGIQTSQPCVQTSLSDVQTPRSGVQTSQSDVQREDDEEVHMYDLMKSYQIVLEMVGELCETNKLLNMQII